MIVYNQTITRSKKRYVFCDLEDYVESLQEDSFDESEEEIICQCPYCLTAYHTDPSYTKPYEKKKLYVKKDYSVGYCHRCGSTYIHVSEKIETKVDIDGVVNLSKEFKLVKLEGGSWSLDLYKELPEFTQEGYDYLVNRRHKYFKDLYKILEIKFLGANPVVPFKYKGELIYYQIKNVDGYFGKLPYFTPPIKYKPAYIIENGANKKFVICEGVYDCISCLILYPDRTPFAVLGSDMTDYQIQMLRSYVPEDILIQMDTTDLSIKVKNRLSKVINYAKIGIVKSNGKDPEEWLKEAIQWGKL
jgi:hypothetical protein